VSSPAEIGTPPEDPGEGRHGTSPRERRRWPGHLRYFASKLGGAVISLAFLFVLSFLLFRILPGDPVLTMTHGAPITAEQIAALRRDLGLDRPLFVQFVDYAAGVLRGDLGDSYTYRRPVSELIGERLWPTILLVGTATLLAAALGLWQGARAGWRHGSRFDRISTGAALGLWSVPTFWLGLILLMVLAGGVGPFPSLFPTRGMESFDAPSAALPYALHVAHHLVLPCVTLVAVVYAQYLLVMRSSLLDEAGSDYLVTARAKGLRDDLVRRRHAVPNALLPTMTLVFLHLGTVVGGAVTVETVYSWPGLGLLLYEGLRVPDLPLVQGVFVFLSASVIIMNVLAEGLYRVLDPRVAAT
jgi:peptide/nickel transport system permease protein